MGVCVCAHIEAQKPSCLMDYNILRGIRDDEREKYRSIVIRISTFIVSSMDTEKKSPHTEEQISVQGNRAEIMCGMAQIHNMMFTNRARKKREEKIPTYTR